MKMQGVNPDSGKSMTMACSATTEDDIKDLLHFDLSEEALKKRLDGLTISADMKSLLFTIVKTTIKVGSFVVRIGRKILDIIIGLLAEFPSATTGAIFGAILGHLVSAVPIIGFVFGPLVAPLALALGFALGGLQDFSNKALANRVAASVASFNGLKP